MSGDHSHPELANRTDIPTVPAPPNLTPYATKQELQQAISDHVAAMHGVVVPPVITPPPVVTPPTGTRPWAPIVPTQPDVQMLPSMATEADIRASFQDFLKKIPNGSRILGDPTATYRHNGSLWLGIMAGRHDLIFDFRGAKLVNTSPAMPADNLSSSNKASAFYWHYTEKPFPHHILIRNAVMEGSTPTPGVLNGSEFQAAIHFMGGDHLEVESVTSSKTFGDFITMNENSLFVYVHNNNVPDCGRNNISVVCGSHLLAEDNDFGTAGYCCFDIEPEKGSIADITDIVYRRNKHKAWTKNCFFALDGANSGKVVSDVTMDANSITGKNLLSIVGFDDSRAGSPKILARPKRIIFTNHVGPAGGAIKFNHIDGLTVKNNPGTSLSISPDSTGVITA